MDRASLIDGKGMGRIVSIALANHDLELRELPEHEASRGNLPSECGRVDHQWD